MKAPAISRNTGTWQCTRHSPPASPARKRREGRREIDVARDRAVPPLHDLVQVDAVVERRERPLGRRRRPPGTRSAELSCSFAMRMPALRIAQRRRRILELHRAVADVVADADMAPQRRRPAPAARPVPACATIAALASACRWSRKNATVSSMVSRKQQGSGSSASTISRPVRRCSCRPALRRAAPPCRAIARAHPGACCRDRLEGARHGRHRAESSFGQQPRQDFGRLIGVGQPLGRAASRAGTRPPSRASHETGP